MFEETKKFISQYLRLQFIGEDAPEDECNEEAEFIIRYLQSEGYVLKVDRELPNENSGKHTWYEDDLGEAGRIGYRLAINDVEEAGYVAVIQK